MIYITKRNIIKYYEYEGMTMKLKLYLILLILCTLTACGNAQPARNTKTHEFAFEDSSGSILVYYLCETTYSGKKPTSFDTVDTLAVQDIFDPTSTSPQNTLEVCGYPCAIYLMDDRAYFCCTISEKSTVVLEYPPNVISEETAAKIIRSIFEPVE